MTTNVLDQKATKKESQDALLDRVKELESELASTKKNEAMWYNSYNEVKAKYESFKNAVKSVVVLVD